MNATIQKPILIVGAGPSGLVLALWLKKNEIPFRIVDKALHPGLTSRALAIQARTLEFYRQLRLDEKITEAGVIANELTFRRHAKIIAVAQIGTLGKGLSPFPYLVFLPQDSHEVILNEELAKLGVQIERGVELIDCEQFDEHVVVRLRNSESIETTEASYVCGCDGAHSVIRHEMAVDFSGGTYDQVFYVADVDATTSISGVQLTVSSKDFCILMPLKRSGGLRLTGIVPIESETKDHVTFDDVADSVRRNSGLSVEKVNWFSTYKVHHRVATHFQKKRIFIVGDAAHIHSPAGGQGMNTGIGDAVNLAWKLADVWRGRISEKVLETYEDERLAFAKVLVSTTDTAFTFIASRGWFGSILRTHILPWVFVNFIKFKPVLRSMFRIISQVRIQYRASELSEGATGLLRSGDRLPYITSNNAQTNYDALNTMNWQVHVYGEATTEFSVRMKTLGLELHVYPHGAEAKKNGLTQNGFYLIRPDGYVALASAQQDNTALMAYMRKWDLRLKLADYGVKPVLGRALL